MLAIFRRLARSWVATVLFVVLIGAFAVWGIGADLVRGLFAQDDSFARVAGQPIALEDAQAAAHRELQRISRQLGPRFQDSPEIRRAIATQAVEQLINQRALVAEADRLHIAIPDGAVRDAVYAIPGLQGPDGRFSQAVLQQALQANGLTEPQFVGLVRADIARQQLLGGVRSGAVGTDTEAKPMLALQREERVAEVVELPRLEAPEPAAPTEAQLRRFHENNPARFSAPEYRQATVVVLSPEALESEVQIADQEIADAYGRREQDFQTPERRDLDQVLVDSEDKAKAIAAAWRANPDFAAIEAKAKEAGGTALHLGALPRDGLPVPALADAAFGAQSGGVTEPVQSPFGWHVLRVNKVEPAATRTLADVRDEIRKDLAQEKAINLSYDRAKQVEDALAGGATLEEAAKRFNLKLATVNTDAQGRDPEGHPVELPILPNQRERVLQAIFATQPNQPSHLTETPQNFFGIEVKQVTPAALRPFETIEPQVRTAFLSDERRRTQEERAAKLLAAVKGGQTLEQAAQAAGLRADRLGPFGREPVAPGTQAATPQPPPELLAPVFELKPNEGTMVETRDGYAVAQLLEIKPFDAAQDATALGQLRGQIEQGMANDLEQQYAMELRRRAKVQVNQRQLDNLLGSEN